MSRVRTTKKSWEYWTVLLLGLFYVATKCDARAVNVSNSWTMPQEGLNVFYRFFRDRISWFEADAVCQFHHAYLVTVDNSFQFDATRDLLRELDVNDIVWIGLMRPQSSDRFMWSNSRALAANTGYWAESLPLMESPLCAVIDPIRDYRWHALRCGGPETASFLCEMPVPSWAESCILKDLPSLTMQYMADTASIELIRNCGEEGLIRQMCRGKQDRERIMRELICPRERLESKKLSDITNSHFKSLQIIRGISTDNNENNDIDLMPLKITDPTEQVQTEKNTVQKLIEQFNVDELMQADQPSKIPGEIPKPVKKSAKKIVVAIQQKKPTAAPKKTSSSRGHHRDVELEDMMMGDQPIPDDASNEIMQPLPHIKKVLPQDLKPMPTMKSTTSVEPATTTTSTSAATAAIDETSTAVPVAPSESSALPDGATTTDPVTTSGPLTTSGPSTATTTSGVVPATQAATIGHPMHPQQQRSNVITEEANHPHVKETNDNHFIPPMLLVKSHYVPPPKGHNDHSAHSAPQDLTGLTGMREDDEPSATGTTTENVHQDESNVQQQTTLASVQLDDIATTAAAGEKTARIEVAEKGATSNSSEIQLQATTTARNEITTQDAAAGTQSGSSTMRPATTPESAAATTFETERVTESVITTTSSVDVTTSPQSPQSSPSTTTASPPSTAAEVTTTPVPVHTVADSQTDEQSKRATEKTEPSATASNAADNPSSTTSSSAHPSTDGPGIASPTPGHQQPAAPHPTRNFLNEETYPPFKPNRRRSLTKPDTPSYFKKILG